MADDVHELPPGMPSDLLWVRSVAVPFDWGWSKNAMWVARAGTHARRLAPAARERRALLADALRSALGSIEVVHAPLWVALRVLIPDHRGDAINALDLAADAVEDATGLDDRWFQLAGLTWAIEKDDPRLRIWVGQTHEAPVQACGACGRVLPFDAFTRSRSARTGRSNACRECAAARRASRRRPRTPGPPEGMPGPGEPPPWISG